MVDERAVKVEDHRADHARDDGTPWPTAAGQAQTVTSMQ
jgi:hypothetical protein